MQIQLNEISPLSSILKTSIRVELKLPFRTMMKTLDIVTQMANYRGFFKIHVFLQGLFFDNALIVELTIEISLSVSTSCNVESLDDHHYNIPHPHIPQTIFTHTPTPPSHIHSHILLSFPIYPAIPINIMHLRYSWLKKKPPLADGKAHYIWNHHQ